MAFSPAPIAQARSVRTRQQAACTAAGQLLLGLSLGDKWCWATAFDLQSKIGNLKQEFGN
jgi:hypothetical protein